MIDDGRFWLAHQVFLRHMQTEGGGEPFISFNHSFFFNDEVGYKRKISVRGQDALQLDHWHQWRSETGRILEATREACRPEVSKNLLEHRYGQKGSSYKALYRVGTTDEIGGLEDALFRFFKGDDKASNGFGARFDRFAEYLRVHSLGCNWDFVTYLSFLQDAQRYFPIRSTRFDSLLKLYKVPQLIAGYVTWERYRVLLDLAEELKERLAIYGPADAIEIQSYMWVVGHLIKGGQVPERRPPPQFEYDQELSKRTNAARERERIGLQGENYIFVEEVDKLNQAGRGDLASRVRVISIEEGSLGFDVLSYTADATELHIEVKTTTRSPANDIGFWLSDNERRTAEQDDQWTVYRVWNIDTTPIHKNPANIVQEAGGEWELAPSTWYATPRVLTPGNTV